MSYETRYAAAMRQRSDAASSTPEATEARLKLKEALVRARIDVAARFPASLPDEAFEYLNERIAYWRQELRA